MLHFPIGLGASPEAVPISHTRLDNPSWDAEAGFAFNSDSADTKGNGAEFYPGEYTESWTVADILPRHLWQYGLVHIDPVQEPWGWTKGDIMAEDWFGTNGKGNFDHLQFVVGTESSGGVREPLIANESDEGHNYPHMPWYRVRQRIQEAEGGAGWARVALAWKHTRANIDEKKHTPANLYGPGGLFHE